MLNIIWIVPLLILIVFLLRKAFRYADSANADCVERIEREKREMKEKEQRWEKYSPWEKTICLLCGEESLGFFEKFINKKEKKCTEGYESKKKRDS